VTRDFAAFATHFGQHPADWKLDYSAVKIRCFAHLVLPVSGLGAVRQPRFTVSTHFLTFALQAQSFCCFTPFLTEA
jgi:hypothetical protein